MNWTAKHSVFLHIQLRQRRQTEGLEQGWKQRARLGRDAKDSQFFFLSPHTPHRCVRLAHFARVRYLSYAKRILRRKLPLRWPCLMQLKLLVWSYSLSLHQLTFGKVLKFMPLGKLFFLFSPITFYVIVFFLQHTDLSYIDKSSNTSVVC